MPRRTHRYTVGVRWTGDLGAGSSAYDSYSRDHQIRAADKPAILGSADATFRGDPDRWTPEELLVAALSACHKLWYLHLCAISGVVVTAYEDKAQGAMLEEADGGGRFTRVVLNPQVTVAEDSQITKAHKLHHDAHAMCFIARSVNFDVEVRPRIAAAQAAP